MNIAQIASIIALLLAFGADPKTVSKVEVILEKTAQVQTISPINPQVATAPAPITISTMPTPTSFFTYSTEVSPAQVRLLIAVRDQNGAYIENQQVDFTNPETGAIFGASTQGKSIAVATFAYKPTKFGSIDIGYKAGDLLGTTTVDIPTGATQ